MKIMKIILEILCSNISLLNGENTETEIENYHDGNIEHHKYWCLSFPLFSFKKCEHRLNNCLSYLYCLYLCKPT